MVGGAKPTLFLQHGSFGPRSSPAQTMHQHYEACLTLVFRLVGWNSPVNTLSILGPG